MYTVVKRCNLICASHWRISSSGPEVNEQLFRNTYNTVDPQTFSISIFFSFSCVDCNTQEKMKTMRNWKGQGVGCSKQSE